MTQDLPPAAELLWGDPRRPRRGPKPSLSVELIVADAVDLADTDGLAALSMQRLAGRLGVGTMSLYRYVPGKDELVSLMLDTAIGDPPEFAPDQHWRQRLHRWARANRDVFLRHPWLLPNVTRPRLMGPRETAWLEAALSALSGTGLAPAAKFDVVMLVNGYVRGVVAPYVDGVAGPDGAAGGTQARMIFDRQDRYPALAAVMSSGIFDDPDGGDRGFEFGLARILDGVERLVDRTG